VSFNIKILKNINLTIGKKLLAGFSLLTIIAIIMAVFSIAQLQKLNYVSEEIKDKTIPGLKTTLELNLSLSNFRLAEIGQVLSNDANEMKRREELLIKSEAAITKNQDDLSKVIVIKDQKTAFTDFKAYWADYKSISNEILAKSKKNDAAGAKAQWTDKEALTTFDLATEQLEVLKNIKIKEAANKVDEGEALFQKAKKLMLIGLIILILLSASLSYIIITNINRSLHSAVEQITEGSNVLADLSNRLSITSDTLSSSSHDQASMVQETAATVEEISQMVSRSSDNAVASRALVTRSNQEASAGKVAVDNMNVSINDISNSNDAIINKIEESNSRLDIIIQIIGDIEQKTKVINEIVFQTKLLSFNASVEAARAGEQGKGFAVVAGEIGNLAQMSGKASTEIAEMLDRSITQVKDSISLTKKEIAALTTISREKVQTGLKTAKSCESALENIISNVNDVSIKVEEIADASKEQAAGVHEINNAISSIDEVTQKNADMAKQTSSIAENLNNQVLTLNEIVSQLKKEVG
jgi:methyl-accepting chemotaxis protein